MLFLDLHTSRSYGMSAPQGLSYAELDAYARVWDRPWEPEELETIRAVDRAFLQIATQRDEPVSV